MLRPLLAALLVAGCGATEIEPADTLSPTTTAPPPPPTIWSGAMNLPPMLTPATVAVVAARGPAIQLTEPPPAPPTTTIPVPPHFDVWVELAECESGGDWSINTGNGYYGGLQFTLTSWNATGGWQHAPRPDLADALDQMWAAEVLLMHQGWGAWPACARRLGLR
jgi:hypothetical protein